MLCNISMISSISRMYLISTHLTASNYAVRAISHCIYDTTMQYYSEQVKAQIVSASSTSRARFIVLSHIQNFDNLVYF